MFPRVTIETRLGPMSVRQGQSRGPALFLLHGIGGNADGWRQQYEAFDADFRVIGWDAPGYGDSFNFSEASPTLEAYADALIALLDAMGVAKAIVVGHSLGGLIAACAAAKNPTRIDRLVLAACSSGHATYDEARRQQILRTRLDAFSTGDAVAYARSRVKNLLSAQVPPAVLEEAVSVMAQIKQPGFPQATRMVSASDIFPWLPKIGIPARVICGDGDQVTPPALNREIAGAIPGADYVAVEKAGHWLFLEFPEPFNAAVRQFIP
jgi:pimeloyl-ACP methyl ester carboxylesterase